MEVLLPTALYSYTGTARVKAQGTTVDSLLQDLDSRYPGIRFRIIDEQDHVRRHMRIFVNGEQVFDLTRPIADSDEVCIMQALSGG